MDFGVQGPRPPNVPLLRALWYLLDGMWGLLTGSCGVLGYTQVLESGRLVDARQATAMSETYPDFLQGMPELKDVPSNHMSHRQYYRDSRAILRADIGCYTGIIFLALLQSLHPCPFGSPDTIDRSSYELWTVTWVGTQDSEYRFWYGKRRISMSL